MIEKTAISLILAITTTALIRDAFSCPREICLKPDGNVIYDGYSVGSNRYDTNFTSFTTEFPSRKYLNGTPMIPIGPDGVISLSECECQSNFCLKKCCSFNSTMDVYNGRCMNDEIATSNIESYKTRGRTPCFGICPAGEDLLIIPLRVGMQFILESGAICMTHGYDLVCLRPDNFCIDYVSSPRILAVASCRHPPVYSKWRNAFGFLWRNEKVLNRFEDVALLISILSLTATFLVYSCFRELRNMHGKCLLCHVASFIVHNVLLISRIHKNLTSVWICAARDIVDYLFYLAPFSWMNVICFDMLMSFMNLRQRHGNSQKAEWKKFALYSLYSWTTPFLAFLATLYKDLSSYSGLYGVYYYAGFTVKLCTTGVVFLEMYLIYPMSVYMVISVVLFVATAIKIHRINASTSILRREEQRREEDENKRSFKMYAKLLVVMGFISWVMEPLHYLPSHYMMFHKSKLIVEYRYITLHKATCFFKDLQGLYISVFFLWNDKIINLVKEKVFKSRARIILHFYPQPQNVEPLSPPDSSSHVSRNPLSSADMVTTSHGSQGSISERGYMVSENRENGRDFNDLTGKPVGNNPSPSVGGSSLPSSIPVGDTNVQVSISTASRIHEMSRF